MSTNISRRLLTEAPRVLVVDGSRVVRQLITRVLQAELPGVEVVGCGSGNDAKQVLGEDHNFSVREFGRRMDQTTGNFFLGMDPVDGAGRPDGVEARTYWKQRQITFAI